MARMLSMEPPVQKRRRTRTQRKADPMTQEPKTDGFGEDPWAVSCRNTRRSSRKPAVPDQPASSVQAAGEAKQPDSAKQAIVIASKEAQDASHKEDNVVLPIPIAATLPLGKIVTSDGREHPFYPSYYYAPLVGFEHCLPAPAPAPAPEAPVAKPTFQPPPNVSRPRPLAQPSSPAYIQSVEDTRFHKSLPVPASSHHVHAHPTASEAQQHQRLKRRRSTQNPILDRKTQPLIEYDDVNDDKNIVRPIAERTHSFYIGDIDALTLFFRRRFEELTTRPLRQIVTDWIKQLEPRRLGEYGPYHKMLPKEQPPGFTPFWWPEHVPYNEPSHLSKTNLQLLAIDVLLQHRKVDAAKRKGSWVRRLKLTAQYTVEMAVPELFSSSKRPQYNEAMKERARSCILPSIFEVAQSYEDHLAQYNLYEGEGNEDPGNGQTHTWQSAPKPPREKVRRSTNTKACPSPPQENKAAELSETETEVDDTISNRFLRRDRAVAQQPRVGKEDVGTSLPSNPPPSLVGTASTPVAPNMSLPMQGFVPNNVTMGLTPSFNQSMTGLQLNDGMNLDLDMDVKCSDGAQFLHPPMRPMYSLGETMAFPGSHSTYVMQTQDTTGSFSSMNPASFAGHSPSGQMNQYPMFATSFPPPACTPGFVDPTMGGFSYECEGGYATPMTTTTTGSFQGLPIESKVDS
ncbi:hypothetical protein IQ07DRAFT_408719 [Pyrenochaeta sp. DS3sAY3a]|nr:hypothetical protein IQ07DRAFT_408719 [Pyrenochaeta sp. DS3sAY3a]